METEVELVLKGDTIPVAAFLAAAEDFNYILTALAKDLPGSPHLSWSLSGLRISSACLAQTAAADSPDNEEAPHDVIDHMITGLSELKEKPERPARFTDRILERSKRMAKRVGGAVTGVVILGRFGNKSKEVDLTSQLVANVDKIVGKPFHFRGSIEGVLEIVSIHGGLSVVIVEPLHGRLIKCICDDGTFEELSGYLRKRLRIRGAIKTDKQGRASEIRVESFSALRTRDALPQAIDVRGIMKDFDIVPSAELGAFMRGLPNE